MHIVDHERAKDFLTEHDWPSGLQEKMLHVIDAIPYRFMILDDSGSMSICDGNSLKMSTDKTRAIMSKSTRWAEMCSAVQCHVDFAEAARAPTEFRFLNAGLPIEVGLVQDDGTNARKLTTLLEGSPGGGTPLCRHVREVAARIDEMTPRLREEGKKVAVIIVTDGQSSDGNMGTALRLLQHKPCYVVVRLCTDEDSVVDYWNDIDNELELQMDVLDDFVGEAQEVMKKNPWLTYSVPVHRFREFGVHLKEFDLLDEKPLALAEARKVCCAILGGKLSDYPDPVIESKAFKEFVEKKCDREPQSWNVKLKKKTPAIIPGRIGDKGKCVIS
jgi:hypothetical protein